MPLNNLGFGFIFGGKDNLSGILGGLMGSFNLLENSANRYALRMMNISNLEGQTAAGLRRYNALLEQHRVIRNQIESVSLAGGLGLAAYGIGMVGITQTFEAAKKAAPFEEFLVHIKSLTLASDHMMAKLKNQALELGTVTKFSIKDIVESMDALATMGKTANQVFEMMPAVTGLATASMGKMRLEDAALAISGTLNAFQMEASKAEEVANKLVVATNLSALGFNEFRTALSRTTASAALTGQSLDDVLIAVGTMKNLNFTAERASTAMTELNQALMMSSKAGGALEKLKIPVLDKLGNFRSSIAILHDFFKATSHLDKQQQIYAMTEDLGLGKRAGIGAKALENLSISVRKLNKETGKHYDTTLYGVDALEEWYSQLNNSKGAMEGLNSQLQVTYEYISRMTLNLKDALVTMIGEGAIETLAPLLKFVNIQLRNFLTFVRQIPKETKGMIAGVVFFTSALFALVGALAATTFGLAAFALAFGVLETHIIAITGYLIPFLGYLGLTTGAFGLLGVAVDKNIGDIGSSFSGWINRMRLTWLGFLQVIGTGKISDELRKELGVDLQGESSKATQDILNNIDSMQRSFFRVKEFLSSLWDGFVNGLVEIDKKIGVFKLFGELMGNLTGENYNFFDISKQSTRTWRDVGQIIGSVLAIMAHGVVAVADGILVIFTLVKSIYDIFVKIGDIIRSVSEFVLGKKITSVLAPIARFLTINDTSLPRSMANAIEAYRSGDSTTQTQIQSSGRFGDFSDKRSFFSTGSQNQADRIVGGLRSLDAAYSNALSYNPSKPTGFEPKGINVMRGNWGQSPITISEISSFIKSTDKAYSDALSYRPSNPTGFEPKGVVTPNGDLISEDSQALVVLKQIREALRAKDRPINVTIDGTTLNEAVNNIMKDNEARSGSQTVEGSGW